MKNPYDHTEQETVSAAVEVISEPTASKPGEVQYTAVFLNPSFSAQTNKTGIPAVTYSTVKGNDSEWKKAC